jgi:hypothetical protein
MVLLEQHMEWGVLGTTSGWPPLYAPSNTPIWAFHNKALSRFISQQAQQIKLQLLAKEYSPLPMHKLSIPFYRGPVETTRVNP